MKCNLDVGFLYHVNVEKSYFVYQNLLEIVLSPPHYIIRPLCSALVWTGFLFLGGIVHTYKVSPLFDLNFAIVLILDREVHCFENSWIGFWRILYASTHFDLPKLHQKWKKLLVLYCNFRRIQNWKGAFQNFYKCLLQSMQCEFLELLLWSIVRSFDLICKLYRVLGMYRQHPIL